MSSPGFYYNVSEYWNNTGSKGDKIQIESHVFIVMTVELQNQKYIATVESMNMDGISAILDNNQKVDIKHNTYTIIQRNCNRFLYGIYKQTREKAFLLK